MRPVPILKWPSKKPKIMAYALETDEVQISRRAAFVILDSNINHKELGWFFC